VLVGYQFDRFERIVTPTSQRIEFYGTTIPEPMTCVMMIVVGILAAGAHRVRRGSMRTGCAAGRSSIFRSNRSYFDAQAI
jgi:hypothetical protein